MQVVYEHYRVPAGFDKPKRGLPPFTRRYMKKGERSAWESTGVSPKGGITVCRVKVDGKTIAVGTAICSMSDNFCYRTGRNIAFGRAMARLEKDMPPAKLLIMELQ